MLVPRYSALCAAFIGAALLAPPALQAADAPATATASPRFDIREFRVEGNTLLTSQEVDQLVKPFTGSARDFGDVQRALEALQSTYQKRGYGAVQVLLPEQELEQGIVRLQVIEQKIASISVEGNEYYETENVVAAIPSLAEGRAPNTGAVTRHLKVANENPTKQTAVLFRSNETDEEAVDVTVKVIDEKPWKAFLTLDNSGSRETGHGRIGLGYQHFNLFGKDHRLIAQAITAPQNPDDWFADNQVRIFGAAYTIPLYERGDSVDFIAGYANVDASIAAGTSMATAGLVLGAHYNHNFDKIDNYDHKLTVAFDYKASRAKLPNGRVTSAPLGLTYAGVWQSNEQQLSFSLSAAWNLIQQKFSHGGADDYANYIATPLAEDDFARYNFNFDYSRMFAKNWQLHLNLNGQITGDHLIAGEQFGIGGMDSVRGFHERSQNGDKGYRYTVEAISPDFGKKFAEKAGLRGVIFFDKGHVANNDDVAGNGPAGDVYSIASLGGGLRYNYGRDVIGRMDYAVVVDADKGPTAPNGHREKGDMFMHLTLGWIW